MRILTLRLHNLNSLVGQWSIDFRHPAFAAEGLFAITGPTGAGKTTILDALCLALYGRTPRLSKLTKGGNEIMSRRTGECSAEVSFETQAGQFRCHWSQHRSRKRPDGELQAPRHELARADTGEILETSLRGVAERIEAVTGMDFDRFTRSMLLAQGGFAAFLQAAADERAPILEQITGTEIYSRISIRVHELRAEQRQQLERLQAELAGMPLLRRDEEEEIRTSLRTREQAEIELDQQLAALNLALHWREDLVRLEQELTGLDREQRLLHDHNAAFAPDRERLRRANLALELAADHAALTAVRRQQRTDQELLHSNCQLLPGHLEAARRAEAAWQQARQRLEACKAEQQTALPQLRRVRDLDIQIGEKNGPIKEGQKTRIAQEAACKALQAKQQQDLADLSGQRAALASLRLQLDTSGADAVLVTELAGWRSQMDLIEHLAGKIAALSQAVQAAKEACAQAGQAWQQHNDALGRVRAELEKIRNQLQNLQEQSARLLEGREPGFWQQRLTALMDQQTQLDHLARTCAALAQSRQSTLDLQQRQVVLHRAMAHLEENLIQATTQQSLRDKEVALLETQLTLLKRIEQLSELRPQLQDGFPCPLCGATEHPFAEGNLPHPEASQQQLAQARAASKAVTKQLAELLAQKAQGAKELEQIATDLEQQENLQKAASATLRDGCAALPGEPKPVAEAPDLAATITDLQQATNLQRQQLASLLQTAAALTAEETKLRSALEQAREQVSHQEQAVLTARHNQQRLQEQGEQLLGQLTAHQLQQNQVLAALQGQLAACTSEPLSQENLEAVFLGLVERRDLWLARNAEKSELEKTSIALAGQTTLQAEQLVKMATEYDQHRLQVQALAQEQDDLLRQRRQLFGDRLVQEEEERLAAALGLAEQALETARQQVSAAQQQCSGLQSNISALKQALQNRDQALHLQTAAFQQRVTAAGFGDEAQFLAAGLTEEERGRLGQQAQQLADQQNQLQARIGEKTALLTAERAKNLNPAPLDDLKAAATEQSSALRALRLEIGGLRQKLADHDRLLHQQQERLQILEAHRQDCERWDLLHELIGSADGKRYRIFAQGLTFERLVAQANLQLQKMTDRYLLICDNAQPLELNVIDTYQAGEIRSTKNLSGGESFLVSLALALGLSHMASKNVRVDSLFLDEGFGTLDGETLETALETLASLQREGKLIGVISHVPALKDRISTRIEVQPQTGGRSLLAGPGVGASSAQS